MPARVRQRMAASRSSKLKTSTALWPSRSVKAYMWATFSLASAKMPSSSSRPPGLSRDLDRQHVGHVDLRIRPPRAVPGRACHSATISRSTPICCVSAKESVTILMPASASSLQGAIKRRAYCQQREKAGVVSWQNSRDVEGQSGEHGKYFTVNTVAKPAAPLLPSPSRFFLFYRRA